ncbi:MarR family winged helix-turn-helix transcriptional regulator [Nocardia sp. alder85J]|uniref:MarR family winged helix-turn-helix transcriptional regulator n=1 Tax=Nocardia sp. alder85J TaxID=2862949 RepID=UPI001CD5D1C1|nr:MarR family transcriptional regulator [Nocardia sp. alder85J]MCX4091883.1 MarR family transcriptional regulator [Nocardia sp. alder85J]
MTNPLALDLQLCFPLYAASRAMTAVYRTELDALGLTYPQYLVMLALWEHDGLTVGELCGTLSLDSGTLSPLLKRLEAAGLVQRRRSAEDERRVAITLTETGRRMREDACEVPLRIAASTGMSREDMETLRDSLQRLTRALTAHIHSKEN